jgi:hypothetical protein
LRNCLVDGGRLLGTVLQEKVPNYLLLLRSKALVVNGGGKGLSSWLRSVPYLKGARINVSFLAMVANSGGF